MTLPGRYYATMYKRVDGVLTRIFLPSQFLTVPLDLASLPAEDQKELLEFQRKVAGLQRAVLGSARAIGEARERIDHIKQALDDTPGAGVDLMTRVRELEAQLRELRTELTGDRTISRRQEPTPPSISDRVDRIVWGQWASSSAPTQTNRDAYRHAGQAFEPLLGRLRRLVEVDLRQLEESMEAVGAPWTPGRIPRWSAE
jgi:chromosome segregation ATPase